MRAVIYLAKQGVPFRGDVEDINLNKNPGNFLALLKDYAETDHLPICIRFVDSECNIREEFIAFIKLERVRAVDISDAIIE